MHLRSSVVAGVIGLWAPLALSLAVPGEVAGEGPPVLCVAAPADREIPSVPSLEAPVVGKGVGALTQGEPLMQAVVEGTVHVADSDEVVGGAEVSLLRDGQPVESVRTGGDGHFRFEGVAAGTYRLRVRAVGFQEWVQTLEVPAEGVVERRAFLLRAAFDLDSLRVLGHPLGIRREETEFGARIDSRAIRMLPIPYEPTEMVAFAPGVSEDRIWGGADMRANLYQVDGLSQTHPGTGGPLMTFSPAWVEAVEIRGLGAGAEHGNFQGGLVNLVTRSGGSELEGRLRSTVESHPLNATNLLEAEVGRERAMRAEVEGEMGGPLPWEEPWDGVRFFAAGHVLQEEVRAQARLPEVEARFLPHREERLEVRAFGKLTWTPGADQQVDLTGAWSRATVDGWGLDGYQAEDALGRLREPSSFLSASWERGVETADHFRVQATRARAAERFTPGAGPDVPAIRTFVYGDPPSARYQNAEFALQRVPETRSLAARMQRRFATGPLEHRLKLGGELTRMRWTDQRERAGGMTWRPPRRSTFDRHDTGTWLFGGIVPTSWGGEVDLHTRTSQDALYLQDHLTVHPRLTLTPGLRWSRWEGHLLPGGRSADRIHAVDDTAWEPRLGAVFEVPGVQEFLVKGHWGRYHQSLLSQFFERVEGGEVFSNRELWYLRDGMPEDPTATFSVAERDAMAQGRGFVLWEVERLNQTGPISADYRQPHVEQWLVGLEKSFGDRVRMEAVWVDRRNRNLVALRDRNLADNYWRFENIHVVNDQGEFYMLGDDPLVLPELYLPHDFLRRRLILIANGMEVPIPPGMELADTLRLHFDEDLWLENVPDARRHTEQLQLTAQVLGEGWGGALSVVWTRVTGNFDSVTGYRAGTGLEEAWNLGAGPWTRPNEQVNFQGRMPGHSPLELKLLLHGELPWGLRGGGFLQAARGERFTPFFRLNRLHVQYQSEDGAPLDAIFTSPVAGQRVLVQPRGSARYPDRFTLDLRLEREIPVAGGRWSATVDLFNVWNSGTVTRINEAVNHPGTVGSGLFGVVDPSAVFGAVWGRVPPRTLRLGVVGRF